MTLPSGTDAVRDLSQFIDAAPTPYHAVSAVKDRLLAGGFRELAEQDPWELAPGDRVFVVRGGGTIVALVLGKDAPSRIGYRLVGAHTDSPNLRVKPRGDLRAQGHRQLSVEVYGSPLLHTWLDRDLSLGGRVSLVDGSTHVVRIDQPICRISSLAIHLSPTLATDGLRLNPQQHLAPTLSLGDEDRPGLAELVLSELEKRAGVQAGPEAIAAYDLALFDTQGAAVSSADGGLLASARLDNLASCHAAVTALLGGTETAATRGIVLYDHEEVGSQSATGAGSLFLRSLLERVTAALEPGAQDAMSRAMARSILVSADMAHAVHPNHADKHDREHSPKLGGGPVIKINANQSYATDAPSAAWFERACRAAGFSAQRFVARNDMRCGSTIGPISAARLGMRTVDVGNPMLSMHSCREVAATSDVPKMIAALGHALAAEELPAPSW